jgi:hypothetical protein
MDSNDFAKRLAVVLNKSIDASGLKKADVAEAVDVSASYLTQLTDPVNKYRKGPVGARLLADIVVTVRSRLSPNNLDKELDDLLRLFASEDYTFDYYARKLFITARNTRAKIAHVKRLSENPDMKRIK